MRIDRPTCSLTYCRENQDNNCFAPENKRESCEFRQLKERLEQQDKPITVYDMLRRDIQDITAKEFVGTIMKLMNEPCKNNPKPNCIETECEECLLKYLQQEVKEDVD